MVKVHSQAQEKHLLSYCQLFNISLSLTTESKDRSLPAAIKKVVSLHASLCVIARDNGSHFFFYLPVTKNIVSQNNNWRQLVTMVSLNLGCPRSVTDVILLNVVFTISFTCLNETTLKGFNYNQNIRNIYILLN